MENSSAESAAVLKPSSRARSARSPRISATILRLSVLPPLAPRMVQALNAFSRRSRRAEYCRNGSIEERDSVMACLPGWPWSLAVCAAAARTASGRPARSDSLSSTITNACSSASRFWLKRVPSTDMRWAIAAIRFLALGSSPAPDLTKAR